MIHQEGNINYMKKMKKADVIVAIVICYVIFAFLYTIITGIGTFVADLIDGPTRQGVAGEAENQYLQWSQPSEQMNFPHFSHNNEPLA